MNHLLIRFFYRNISCLLISIFLVTSGCGESDENEYNPPVSPTAKGNAAVWLTTGDQSGLLSKQPGISIFSPDDKTNAPIITIDSTQVLQEIEGFGAALTGSSAYLINRKMNAGQREALLRDLFDPENGIGVSYLRITIGASDFSLSDYTYNDLPAGETDYSLEQFSISKDMEDVVPVLKSILQIAPDLKIMGSPWSAPAWMKTNGSLKGGKLKPEAYDAYALYFVKYIEAYENQGISVDAITLQNEPLHFTAGYPCMEMTADEQRDFVGNHLGPLFEAEGIDTKIILYDHNWDNTQYAISILNDATARKYAAGTAFHAYAGDVSAMSVVHNAHPDKGLYFTEISGGEWATNFSDNLQWNMSNIFIGTTKNWSKTALLWNLALDENFGPQNNGCSNCRGVVTVNSGSGSVIKNVEYYSIGHFSKFIRKGPVRIGSSISENINGVDFVAFLNDDGTKVLVLSNSGAEGKTVTMRQAENQLEYTVPGKSVATVVWR